MMGGLLLLLLLPSSRARRIRSLHVPLHRLLVLVLHRRRRAAHARLLVLLVSHELRLYELILILLVPHVRLLVSH
jgi:hypothetical protein